MKDIEFKSHGVICRAWLCPPESEALRTERGLSRAGHGAWHIGRS